MELNISIQANKNIWGTLKNIFLLEAGISLLPCCRDIASSEVLEIDAYCFTYCSKRSTKLCSLSIWSFHPQHVQLRIRWDECPNYTHNLHRCVRTWRHRIIYSNLWLHITRYQIKLVKFIIRYQMYVYRNVNILYIYLHLCIYI